MHHTLIGTQELARQLEDPLWRVVDCRFSLLDPARGRGDHARGHVPGAVYAHLDEDLSAPVQPGRTGRHPLPEPDDLARRLGEWGIDGSTQVVAYDDGSGGVAARLWWLLRWLGHDAAAVLDGGWAAWTAAGLPVDARQPAPPRRLFLPAPRPELLLPTSEVAAWAADGRHCLMDAREAPRYRGEAEPIDAVAGRIPGALSAPYLDNLGPDGRWLPAAALARRYRSILGPRAAADCAVYCGSGVTAAHDVLAMVHAGLGEPRLYAGSWSEWITDASRGVATGG
jgi:thiosulfate/3-mercaptopyruvate sulfurtransferase